MLLVAALALTPTPVGESLRIERMSVLEQRSGWRTLEKSAQLPAPDCEVSFARIVLTSAGLAQLEHIHAFARPAQLPTDSVELHYRTPSSLPGTDVPLFDGNTLSGWHLVGEASFTPDDHTILAQTSTGKANSFLVTDATYGDFLLTLELKNDQPGNSGIQIRSRVVGSEPKSSYATGYQIEIDPSPRAWSGGLYEERARGWLQSLEHNDAGRKAFHSGEWNRYRIECIGPWIRAWVNDIPTTDAFDPEALDGILGLQVHAGQDTRVRFRNFNLHLFGHHAWSALDAKHFTTDGAPLGNDFGLRLTRTPNASLAGYQICFRGEKKSVRAPESASDLLRNSNQCWSIPLDDPRLANSHTNHDWQQLVLLAYSDRLTLFRDHELILDSRAFTGSDGPWVWIERPNLTSDASAFADIESLEQAAR